jgi:homospermidine synthase
MDNKLRILENQKLVIFGIGAVGKCIVNYINDFIIINYNTSLFLLDKNIQESNFPVIQKAIQNGAKFIHHNINTNLNDLFDNVLKLKKFDIIIDVTTRTNTFDIFKEVRKRGILYINTSIEDSREDKSNQYMDKTIFYQHINLKHIDEKLKSHFPITTLIEYGMNPGLISTFVKYGIKNLARQVLEYQEKNALEINQELYEALQLKKFNKMSKILGIKVIHCSEIDTQVPLNTTDNRLINNWSCLGLIDEGIEPVEIMLGTHENLVKDTIDFEHNTFFDQLLVINNPGYKTLFKSVVPEKIIDTKVKFTNIIGRCIHHGEGISLNRFLSDNEYAPTMHYVYKLSPLTSTFLDTHTVSELQSIGNGEPHKDWHVMNVLEDKINGYDNVGALFILDKNPFNNLPENYMFWTGSILSTDYTKNILNDEVFGPTIIQVMAGVLGGLSYIIENKDKGLIFGEDVCEKYIINKIRKYLGVFYSGPVPKSDELKLPVNIGNLIVKY